MSKQPRNKSDHLKSQLLLNFTLKHMLHLRNSFNDLERETFSICNSLSVIGYANKNLTSSQQWTGQTNASAFYLLSCLNYSNASKSLKHVNQTSGRCYRRGYEQSRGRILNMDAVSLSNLYLSSMQLNILFLKDPGRWRCTHLRHANDVIFQKVFVLHMNCYFNKKSEIYSRQTRQTFIDYEVRISTKLCEII